MGSVISIAITLFGLSRSLTYAKPMPSAAPSPAVVERYVYQVPPVAKGRVLEIPVAR